MNADPPDAAARDRLLVAAVIRGDAEALDTWYRREHPQVFRLALGFLARWEEAEDLGQDAMLHLLEQGLAGWLDPDEAARLDRPIVLVLRCTIVANAEVDVLLNPRADGVFAIPVDVRQGQTIYRRKR